MDIPSRQPFPQWRFLQLTLAIVAWMLVSPHLETRWTGHLAMQVLLLDLLLVTIWANPRWRRARHVVGALWLLSLVASATSILDVTPHLLKLEQSTDIVLAAPVILACTVGVLSFAFRAERPTVDGIFAMVVAYFLIAMLFAEFYYLLLVWDHDALRLLQPMDQISARELRSELMYFSLVTLATVGYGDILPGTAEARTLATVEAVVGQFFVAVVVASFVGMYAARYEAQRLETRVTRSREREGRGDT
jgi:hypothetical protein